MSQTRLQGEGLTLVWSEVTGWPAARPRYLPLGSVFLLDILCLMNCHSFSFRMKQRKWTTARTRPLSPWWPIGTFQLSFIVVHSENRSCHRSSSTRVFFSLSPFAVCVCACVLPSLLYERTLTHTHTHSWQAATASWPRHNPRPLLRPPNPIFCSAFRHLCTVKQLGRESWGNFRVGCWNRTRGPPQQSYITVKHSKKKKKKKILLCAPYPLVKGPIMWTHIHLPARLCFSIS